MPIILSLVHSEGKWIAAGPEGLYFYSNNKLHTISQPQEQLLCAIQLENNILVGGSPHGIAISADGGEIWHPAQIKHDNAQVVAMVADIEWSNSGILLAATIGQGIFRSEDRGWHWHRCNFGLHTSTILCLAWANPLPKTAYPRWQVVFAGGDDGIYRSLNGGLGWKRCTGDPERTQIIVPERNIHQTGMVLAGTESDGLWISDDGGYNFERITTAPNCINALVQVQHGWLLSDEEQMYRSNDAKIWYPIVDSQPALILHEYMGTIMVGSTDGIRTIEHF